MAFPKSRGGGGGHPLHTPNTIESPLKGPPKKRVPLFSENPQMLEKLLQLLTLTLSELQRFLGVFGDIC